MQAQGSVTVSSRLGFDEIVPRGRPAPLTVLVENGTADPVDVHVQLMLDGNFGQTRGPSHTLSISPGVGKQFTFLVEATDYLDGHLAFTADHEVLWQDGDVGVVGKQASLQTQLFLSSSGSRTVNNPIVVMGGRSAQLVSALRGGRRGSPMHEGSENGSRQVWFTSLDQRFAPDNQLAWAGVKLVIWTEPDVAGFGDESQFTALRNWLSSGGQLLILSATQPRLLSAPELKPFLPVPITGVSTVPYPEVPLEDENQRVRNPFPQGVHFHQYYHNPNDPWIDSATGPLLQARPDASSIHAPRNSNWAALTHIGWRKQYGAGVVFVASYDPLVYDQGNSYPLLQATAVAAGLNFRSQDSYDHYGTEVGEVRESRLRHLREGLVHGNVLRLSLAPYILLAVLFLILIGPVDYVLLNRAKKLKYSAFTLVGYALLFTAAAVVSTFFLFAPSAETNRIAFVDFTELEDGSEHATGYVLHGTYRPLGDSYLCDIENCQVFGSEEARNRDASSVPGYAGPGRHPAQVNQPFNSFRMLRTAFAGKPTGTVSARIVEVGDAWALDITNGMAEPIQGGVLRFSTRAALVPELAPGESTRVDLSRKLWHSINNLDAKAAQRVKLGDDDRSPFSDLPMWLLADAVTGEDTGDSAMPWEARLRPGEAIFYGITKDYPFTDSFGDSDTGFNLTVVRRRIELPASMTKALGELKNG